MTLSEFDLIGRYFSGHDRGNSVVLGVGDDAAVVRGHGEWAVCIDTLVAGVHFPPDAPAESVGHKALAVNLSDLAAMGADPAWALLALTLPAVDEAWLEGFSTGFKRLAAESGIRLVGGDTTRGPLAVTVQVAGTLPPGQALRRSAAQPGDAVYVSGSLGDGAAGLESWRRGERSGELLQRLHAPSARIDLGRRLHGIAHAAVDISDGLLADLGHVLDASGVGATLWVEKLPLSPSLLGALSRERAQELALSGGDDYELCFTAPPSAAAEVAALAAHLALPLTEIGRTDSAPGLRLLDRGRAYAASRRGYRHFEQEGQS